MGATGNQVFLRPMILASYLKEEPRYLLLWPGVHWARSPWLPQNKEASPGVQPVVPYARWEPVQRRRCRGGGQAHLGLCSGFISYELYDLRQMTEPLCSCFLFF